MGSLLTHKNIYAPLTPCKPEGQMATRQRERRGTLSGTPGLWGRSLGKDAGRTRVAHLLGHPPPPHTHTHTLVSYRQLPSIVPETVQGPPQAGVQPPHPAKEGLENACI